MPIAKRTVRSTHSHIPSQKRAFKALLVGFACLAGVVMVAMAPIAVDPVTPDVDPDQTAASSTLLGP
jgi:hypothetical protein